MSVSNKFLNSGSGSGLRFYELKWHYVVLFFTETTKRVRKNRLRFLSKKKKIHKEVALEGMCLLMYLFFSKERY